MVLLGAVRAYRPLALLFVDCSLNNKALRPVLSNTQIEISSVGMIAGLLIPRTCLSVSLLIGILFSFGRPTLAHFYLGTTGKIGNQAETSKRAKLLVLNNLESL